MIKEVIIYLMRTDVIQNPSFPSIFPMNYKKISTEYQVRIKNDCWASGLEKITKGHRPLTQALLKQLKPS